MIADAERRGLLAPGGTIVEPTSGNTGVASRDARGGQGLPLRHRHAGGVRPGQGEADGSLRRVGHPTPSAEPHERAIERARQIAAATPGAWMPNQFSNPVNPRAHYETTGPEIGEVLGDSVDALVAGVGTSGTFMGVARYLPRTDAESPERRRRAAGLDPRRRSNRDRTRSKASASRFSGDPRTRPDRRSHHDHGRGGLRDLPAPRPRGRPLAGGSSGVAAAAALQIARGASGRAGRVVTIFPDGAERYPGQGILESPVRLGNRVICDRVIG